MVAWHVAKYFGLLGYICAPLTTVEVDLRSRSGIGLLKGFLMGP